MAELGFTVGFLTMAGTVTEDTYGVEKRVTEPLVIISETLSASVPLIQPPALDARSQRRQGLAGNLTIGGDIVVPLRYGVGHPFFKNWFGTYTASTGLYIHAATTAGLSMTFAIRKGATVWAFLGVKIHTLVLNATPDLVQLTASVYATDYTKESAINTDAVLRRLVDPAADVLYRHFRETDGQSSIWIGTQEDALTVLDKIAPGDITLTLGRPLDQVQTNEGLAEPAENDYPPVTFAGSLPHHNSNIWEEYKQNATELQARVRFVHPTTGEFKLITLPNVQVSGDATVNIGGPGAAAQPISLTASEAERVLTSTGISAAAADNSLNVTPSAGTAATGTLTLTGAPTDGETVTIGGRVYEIDTETFPGTVTSGRVRVDLNTQATKASQTLTIDTQPTAADTFTIGTKVFTMVATGTADANGEVNIGASLAVSQANIVAAVNGTDAFNTAHPTVTMAPFTANLAVITAKAGGTAGNAIATTETFTAVTNVFAGATLAGGLSPTADQAVTALVTAINADDEALVTAVDGAGSTVVVTAESVGTAANAFATTETLANGSWGAGTLTGGVDKVEMPYCVAGAQLWVSGMLAGSGANNGVAEVVSRTTAKIIIKTLAAAGALGGITLVNESAGATVELVARSPDVIMQETAA